MRVLKAGIVVLSLSAVTPAAILDARAAGAATPEPVSGFLGDYSRLTPDPAAKHQLWWEQPGFDWRAYDKILLEPVVVVPRDGARLTGIDAGKVREIVDGCVAQLVEDLGDAVTIVNEPGPGVLRLRVAVTDIEPVNAVVNAATAVLLLARFDLGGATIEAEFLDGVTGERMAALVSTKSGSVLGLVKGANRYGDARAACRAWARDLETALATNP